MIEPTDRFPSLEHLNWARFAAGRGRYCLSRSQVPPPPPEVFDCTGEMPLTITPEIRDRYRRVISTRYGMDEDELTLTAGVSEALFLTASALATGPGDRVLVESPRYRSLAAVYEVQGARVCTLERGVNGALAAEGARERIESVAAAARGDGERLRAVVLSDLHNPTGAPLEVSALDAIAAGCEKVGARLVIDEVYRDSDPGRPIGSARQRHPEVITISSLTKSYGMGGLRAGWVSAPVRDTRVFTGVQSYLSVQPAAPSMVLATRALERGDGILSWARELLAANRRRFLETIASSPGGFLCPAPGAGSVVFPHRPGGPDTRDEVAGWLSRDGIEVVPGSYFGAPEGVRIGLGVDPETFEEAIGKWAAAASPDVEYRSKSSPGSLGES